MTVHSIRVVNYCGDYDDLHDVNIIGPYPDTAARDRDIRRLAALPDIHGSLEFQPSQVAPSAAMHSCTPEATAGAADLEGVLLALRLILPSSPPSAVPEPTLPGL